MFACFQAVCDNGSKVTGYSLEYDQVQTVASSCLQLGRHSVLVVSECLWCQLSLLLATVSADSADSTLNLLLELQSS